MLRSQITRPVRNAARAASVGREPNRFHWPNDVMSRRNRGRTGFTLIEIVIVVGLIALLAIIAIPNLIRTRTTAQTNVCINNLRTIDYAIQQWALEQKKGANAAVQFTDISGYMKSNVLCPAGGTTFADSYAISSVGAEPSCQRVPGAHLIVQPGIVVASSPTGSTPTSTSPTDGVGGDSPTGTGSGSQPGPGSGSSTSHTDNGSGKNKGKGNGKGP